MQIPEGCDFAYIVSHEAWYRGQITRPSVTVCASAREGGVAWEFTVEEYDFSGETSLRVNVFGDAFDAFAHIPEFFAAIDAEKPKDLKGLAGLLDRLGAADQTERIAPGAEKNPDLCPTCHRPA